MTGQQRNSNIKFNGKCWSFENSHCGRWAVSTTPSDTFLFASLFRWRISDSVKSLTLVPRDPNLVNSTNNINVFIFVLHICLRARLRLTHTAYFIWSIWTSHRTLLASLSSNFSSGTSKGEGETAARTIELVSAWDELISSRKMTLTSDMFRNSIRRTWLIGCYRVDL